MHFVEAGQKGKTNDQSEMFRKRILMPQLPIIGNLEYFLIKLKIKIFQNPSQMLIDAFQ